MEKKQEMKENKEVGNWYLFDNKNRLRNYVVYLYGGVVFRSQEYKKNGEPGKKFGTSISF